MPFITEEIWQHLKEGVSPYGSIALAPYPKAPELNPRTMAHMGGIERDMVVLQSLISDVRTIRAEVKIPIRQNAPAEVFTSHMEARKVFEQNVHIIEKMAHVSELRFVESSLANKPNSRVNPHYEVRLVYEHKVDPAVERERLGKELKDLESQLGNARGKLANEKFLTKASAELVDGTKKREAELVELISKVKSALEKVE